MLQFHKHLDIFPTLLQKGERAQYTVFIAHNTGQTDPVLNPMSAFTLSEIVGRLFNHLEPQQPHLEKQELLNVLMMVWRLKK